MKKTKWCILTFFAVFELISCGGGTTGESWENPSIMLTWVAGSSFINSPGVYGTKGSPAAGNMPGARNESMSWVDSEGKLWLFGGYGFDGSGERGYLSDLWQFDGAHWTWVAGGDTINNVAIYGTMGSPAAPNAPGARSSSVSWKDSSGDLWLLGGYGYIGSRNAGHLNDLWRFDGNYWTWISGNDTLNNYAIYGTLGSPDVANSPGARHSSVAWADSIGNLWLFGGSGYCGSGSAGYLSDLWYFDGMYWTWVSGANTLNSPGFYGTMGSPASSNTPGARRSSISWIDGEGNLWLFGGFGFDGSGNFGFLNDLWRFDGNYWTWVSGASNLAIPGIYGTMGSPASSYTPGARHGSVSWTDKSGGLWLFGGYGVASSGAFGRLNDLWQFDENDWTWMAGSDSINSRGAYGTMGPPSSSNMPGARFGSISWTDSAGDLWLFGGDGYDSGGTGRLNDLWRFTP